MDFKKNLDVIISTGGTGLTGRDVTVEAHSELYEKRINAFEILFTRYLWKQLECQLYKVERVLVLYLVRFFLHYLVHLQLARMLGIKYYANNLIIEIYRNFVEILPRLEEHKRRK